MLSADGEEGKSRRGGGSMSERDGEEESESRVSRVEQAGIYSPLSDVPVCIFHIRQVVLREGSPGVPRPFVLSLFPFWFPV